VVARDQEIPYGNHEARWLTLLARYAAVILENISLQGQLGRIHKEADSVMQAGGTLIALPNLAAALEMACRKVIDSLHLKAVQVFLYGDRLGQGCHVISYPCSEPTQEVSVSLQGRGVSLLRKLLSSGAPVIANRQSECLELFEVMGWQGGFHSVACFPLDIQHHRWGALCLLAEKVGVFPPETQRNLAIFSGEVAMALENAYLRQVLSGKRS
jgi:transcriptional regulator with GAF, ATPase, and Fis domain